MYVLLQMIEKSPLSIAEKYKNSGYNETYWITKDYDDISNLIWSIEDENMRREFHSMIDEVDLSEICTYAKF